MIKIVLIFDEGDAEMGVYFGACASHAKSAFNLIKTDLYEIASKDLNAALVDLTVEKIKGEKFVCLVYSHGCRTSFIGNGHFIVMGATKQFNKSFFYTFSCDTGTEIGEELVQNGCVSFWGYKNKAGFVVGYIDLFVECANFGMMKMVEGHKCGDAFDLMKRNYDEKSYLIYKSNFVVASLLMSNKDIMVLHGDHEASLNDFVIA